MSEFDGAISGLRQAGADRLDPVAFHYLEVLNRRTNEHEGRVRRILAGKLIDAVTAFRVRFEQVQNDASNSVPVPVSDERPAPGPLGLLAREFEPNDALKSVAYFRAAWSRLSTNKQVAKAIDETPKNPGPINSHGLVLRSLAVMRDISPDYLNRFVNYTDTLLSLDQLGQETPTAGRQVTAASAPRKPAPRRAPSRKPSEPGN